MEVHSRPRPGTEHSFANRDVALRVPDVALRVSDVALRVPDAALRVSDVALRVPDAAAKARSPTVRFLRDHLASSAAG